MSVRVRRIYDPPEEADGTRVLVDRLWPRGVSKARAHLDLWDKGIAPSAELRQWYGHLPDRYDEFVRRYEAELREPDRAKRLTALARISAAGQLTLLTASRRSDISEATVIAGLLASPRTEAK